MPKYNKERSKRIKNLIVVSVLSAVLLSISTFAWFIGMRTVHVSAFEVDIAGVDGLLLSLDGKNFDESVTINKDNFDDYDDEKIVYENHTNSWTPLIPMSSVGEIDGETSRLVLYEKASMTATPGGYRLLASRVNNHITTGEGETAKLEPEAKGYVAFDLFIENKSGEEYFDDMAQTNEEAIYLTVDSEVTVKDGGVKDTGIENSVRVGFAQIGRVEAKYDKDSYEQDLITGISCESEVSGVTSICRTATIWEPNDTAHVDGAIKWYNKSCKARTGDDVWADEAYNTDKACDEIVDGQTYSTYAINQEILKYAADEETVDADIYDGFNGFEKTIQEGETADYPQVFSEFPYFTDTYKYRAGTERPPFMYLAPKSITKVRVYIWIEGQDIDNYDFAQIGKQITINFGFTKNRFEEEDIDYNGPITNQQLGPNGEDLTPPRVVLNSYVPEENEEGKVQGTGDLIEILKDTPYHEPGASAYYRKFEDGEEVEDGDSVAEGDIIAVGTVNTAVPGTYYITYKAQTEDRPLGTAVRTIVVTEQLSGSGD